MTDELGKISYTYDKNGNILTVTDESGTITREYDKRNLLAAYTDAGGNRIEYTYDELGNLITLTYPDGTAVHHSYDKTGLLICMTDDQSRVTKYSYDANGNLIQTLRPDESTETIVRDKAGKMLSKKDIGADGVIYEATYTYDASGNIVSLTSANSLSALDFEETEMEYDSANRLIKWNGFSLVYDADGNMTYGPLNGKMEAYVYDCRNRLIRAGDTSYTYDAQNNRIGVFTPKEKTTYVVDSSSSLTQILLSVSYLSEAADGVYSETGTQTKYYYGSGLAAQSDSLNGYLTYHFDHLGSTAALTDISGKTVFRYAYGTYGELAQGDTKRTRFLYNGQYGVVTDANGLYQMRARYYSPDLKRFVNQDVLLGACPQQSNSFPKTTNSALRSYSAQPSLVKPSKDIISPSIGISITR